MADQGYRRPKRLLFDVDGIDINSPLDRPKSPRRVVKLKNMTVEVDGTLTTRPGFANLYAAGALVVVGQTPCHSEIRISDDASSLWARVIGTGTHLAVELSSSAGTTASVDSGYDGTPFTFATYRPSESAKLFAYVGNDTRMRKVDVAGVDKQIGLPPPTSPPTVEVDRPYFKELGDMQDNTQWVAIAPAGAASLVVGKRVDTTLEVTSGSIYDSGTTGWACFRPVSLLNIAPGSLLDLFNGVVSETVRVAEVHRAGTATTIATIIYETGTSGICTIQPTNSVEEFRRNAVVKLVNGATTEYARILAVVYGINGQRCIRVRTTSAGGFVATNTLQVVNSFRAYTGQDTYTGGDTVDQEGVQSISSAAGTMKLTDTENIDLTTISSYSPAIPLSGDDYLTLGLKISDLSKVTNIRVLFSLDAGAFTSNYYYYTIEQSVLVAAAKNTQTNAEIRRRSRQNRGKDPVNVNSDVQVGPRLDDEAIERILERVKKRSDPTVPSPVKPSGETSTGDDQWFDIAWRRNRMERVGKEHSTSWKDITAVRIEATVIESGVIVAFNSLNVSGGFNLDVGETGVQYVYRYRGRDSTTGVVSDYSPECLEQIDAYREQAIVTMTQHSAPEVDKLDIERWGGTEPTWLLVGTVANSATPTYTDNLSDLAATANAAYSDRRVLQPWVRFSSPLSGTASIVAGNMVRDNGGTVMPSDIVPGTRVIVNGIATSIRRYIAAATWEVADSIGTATTVAWEMPIQVRAGRPLGAIWRHDVDGSAVLFACDGPYLRWTIGNNPDATRSTNYLEITDASDPLIMGFSHNGRCGVFSSRDLFWITGDSRNGFRADRVPNGRGLFSRYALAVRESSALAWLSKDGIFMSEVGSPDDIVDMDLGPLFINEEGGGLPTTINGIRAPKITSSESSHLRLDFADDGSLFFLYRDQSAARGCLRYVPYRKGWLYYEFGQPLTFVHSEEGKSIRSLVAGDANGKLHRIGFDGTNELVNDDGTAVDWEVQTFCEDFGDARPNKRIGDFEVDAHPNSQTINVELGFNLHATTVAAGTITGATQLQKLFDVNSGNGTRARNVSLRLHGSVSSGPRPRLFSWEPSVLEYPADTMLRAAQWQHAGYEGEKYVQGVVMHGDTYNVEKTVRFEKDGGTLIESVNFTWNGERREVFLFATPVKANLLRIATTDADTWTLIDWKWLVKPDKTRDAELWHDGGYPGNKYMQGVIIHADTFNVAQTIEIQKDGGTVLDTITITHNGERREPYAFDVTSDALRRARLLRIVTPNDTDPWSLLDWEWKFNKEPYAAKVWEIQYGAGDNPEYFHVFQIMLALLSSATTTIETFADGTLIATNTIASTGGVIAKPTPITLPAVKAKLMKWRLESTADLEIFLRDCTIWMMPYAGDDYQIIRPFGGPSLDIGAEV